MVFIKKEGTKSEEEKVARAIRWLELLMYYDIDFLYHLAKVNV